MTQLVKTVEVECSHFCELVSQPAQPRNLENIW
ncbi:MAG: hypothetical protein V7646_2150 [Pseudonocardia sp.]|jgi:hypothetical protein